ncbi:S8 family serine peptidase [Streptomyces amakusaensis]|uniref:S8 family serine peptidase n=1 Tax=Streptomyces amakusaensis TaxID=67271 RepID=A0ABW0AL85_9ACTN
MFNKQQRAGVSALTVAVSLALVAGMTGVGTATATASSPHGGSTSNSGSGVAAEWVTLITGDRVRVDGQGKVTGFDHAEGREGIAVQTYTERGHTYAVPHDARELIADGRLDQRLFDVTELSRAESRKAYRDGLRLIVEYGGAAAGAGARKAVRTAGETELNRSLKALNADAVTATPELWETLTRGTNSGARATAAGISRIWLDGIRRATLERSTGQIGAPKAWESGYEGKGVKIAVLDTGVDAEHPDLKGRVVAAQDFSGSPDATDRNGHGTHVASTAAGSGARSKGTHRGVAPQAEILNGKVLDDDGFGSDSGTLAAMEWAVAQGADIVNLSLGGRDTPEIDPLEAHINKVTAESGVLFAVAAGNGGPQTVGSPGSADGALTVGAVDHADKLADFSSTGPRLGGGLKPDVAAPGVNISAAAASGTGTGTTPGYTSMSGTSMATPHVAGAAALLKQRHPRWKAKELRSALVSSAQDTGHTPYEQGTGRIVVDKAMNQTVVAEESSLDLGKQAWPHTDNTPVTKKITYRNSGTADIDLDLRIAAHGPAGKPVPAGFFALGTDRVTVPAGGTASVDFTADTRIGTDNGHFTATVVASSGDGQTVRSTAAVEREVESYEVTFKHLGRDGKPSRNFESTLSSRTDGEWHFVNSADGDVTLRLPKGEYVLDAQSLVDPDNPDQGRDMLIQPRLTVDKTRTVTLDARHAKPVKMTVPDKKASFVGGFMQFTRSTPDGGSFNGFYATEDFARFRVGHLGPQVTDGSLKQVWAGNWHGKGAATDTEYNAASGGPVKRIATGYTRAFKAEEFAAVKVGIGSSAKGKQAVLGANLNMPLGDWGVSDLSLARPLPDTRTMYVTTGDKAKWSFTFLQLAEGDPENGYRVDAGLDSRPKTYPAGKTHKETFNTAVFSPAQSSLARLDDRMMAQVPLFSDGRGHTGSSATTSEKTTLHRDGKQIAESTKALTHGELLPIGSEPGRFKLTTSVTRAAATARVSTRIDADWTFRAGKAPANDVETLPISTVRFTNAKVSNDSTAPAGATQTIPLHLHGTAAKANNVKSLTAHASYDGGKTWRKLTITNNKATVKNPAKGKAITLRAQVTDKQGGTAKVTVHNAFFGK